jgi:cellulose synthase/poly-beta-1,6-N-acetylglucosamine synthase-like glycosyltransferase
MFNEHAVAKRVIEAASAMTWPVIASACRCSTTQPITTRGNWWTGLARSARGDGVDCRVLRRADRQGYKAGALEAGRRETDAEYVVIFDADFVPPADYLLRAIPHFYLPTASRTPGSPSCRRSGATSTPTSRR